MTRRYFRPIQEDTIVSVLHFMRQEAVRDGCKTLPHIDALLVARGVDPATLTIPRKTPKAFKKGELRRLVLEALREGLKTGRQIADYVEAARPDLPGGVLTCSPEKSPA